MLPSESLCLVLYFLLSYRLEGTEEKFRNRESRPEDLQIIAELKDMVSERESLVKKLVVGHCWWGNMCSIQGGSLKRKMFPSALFLAFSTSSPLFVRLDFFHIPQNEMVSQKVCFPQCLHWGKYKGNYYSHKLEHRFLFSDPEKKIFVSN